MLVVMNCLILFVVHQIAAKVLKLLLPLLVQYYQVIFIGVTSTHRESSDYHNTVLSVDGSYWFNQSDTLNYQTAAAGGAVDLLAGKEPVARWRTNGRRTVGIREANPLGRHTIKPRRLVGGLGVVAGEVTEAEVVGVDDDDVGERCGARRQAHGQSEEGGEEEGSGRGHGLGRVRIGR